LRTPVGDLQTFYNARLLADGRTVELYFNEQLLTGNEAAIESRLSVLVSGYTVGVLAGSLAIGDSDAAVAGNDYRKVTFQLNKDVTAGLTAKINYVDPTTGDETTGVIQDLAGNDVASGLWSSRNGSTVTNLTTATSAIKVFADGMVGGRNNIFLNKENQIEDYSLKYKRGRQYYLSLDLDLTKINMKPGLLKTFCGAIGILKIPAPTIAMLPSGHFAIHPLYY
jgi:hypothetical protein